ncbi:MAG: hypothetical protein ICV84_15580 [Flavisolibacter sp.]|nr:hypothetical protein [Flavisolibacter sp.]
MRYYFEEDEKRIFHRTTITRSQWITFAVYILISIALIHYPWVNVVNEGQWLARYIFLTHIIFYVVHRQFKNLNLFLLWLGVGVMHIWMSFQIKDDFPDWGNRFQFTIPILLLLQVLRLISYGIIKDDFAVPSRFSRVDIDGRRNVKLWDFVILLAYFGLLFYLPLRYKLY